jgi:hypothetical protein
MAMPGHCRRHAGACLLTLVLQLTLVEACTAAEPIRQLSFNWPRPAPGSACDLHAPEVDGKRKTLRFAGVVERSPLLGFSCTVQIDRRRFDAVYRFCTVENVDAVPRERYACWVMYSPTHVTFLYSYTDDYYGAPACEFACTVR